MPPSSIPRSRSGTTSKATPPTRCGGTHVISAAAGEPIPAASAARKPHFARSSSPLISLLPRGHSIIAYAKRNSKQRISTPQLRGSLAL